MLRVWKTKESEAFNSENNQTAVCFFTYSKRCHSLEMKSQPCSLATKQCDC